MHYKFPEIKTINDVLPYIKDREEFIVAERDFGTVINYMVSMPDTFNMSGPDDIAGAIRRECRGIIFNKEGKIMSRPFHKFFNIGEREETQFNKIDLSIPHVIMEKMDGSMIRPLIVNGKLRLGTKMGITEVSTNAEAWLFQQNKEKREWLEYVATNNITPLFEWISKKNQIVIDYEEEDLVYLGSRNNFSGNYYMEYNPPFNIVQMYGSIQNNINEYIANARNQTGREGDIIRFYDGHMFKSKNDWYVRIHKTMDRIRFDRNIVDLILNEQIDDVKGLLPEHEVEKIIKFEEKFWTAFDSTEKTLLGIYREAGNSYNYNRKLIATEYIPKYVGNKSYSSFIFGQLDGKNLRNMLLDHVKKNINTNVKWEECSKFLGM